jgi:uncharacterized protein YgiM (DUF1202 family)
LAKVVLPRALTNNSGLESELVIEAATVRALMRQLDALSPGISALIEEGMSIAIDGEIYSDAMFEELTPDNEVHFIPRLRGG